MVIMLLLSLLPPLSSLLALALHFYRSGNFPVLLLCLLLLVTLLIRHPWAARLLQAVLVIGSVEWVRTGILLSLARIEMGAPVLRLALILGGVALGTACSLLVFRTRRMRRYFRLEPLPLEENNPEERL